MRTAWCGDPWEPTKFDSCTYVSTTDWALDAAQLSRSSTPSVGVVNDSISVWTNRPDVTADHAAPVTYSANGGGTGCPAGRTNIDVHDMVNQWWDESAEDYGPNYGMRVTAENPENTGPESRSCQVTPPAARCRS